MSAGTITMTAVKMNGVYGIRAHFLDGSIYQVAFRCGPGLGKIISPDESAVISRLAEWHARLGIPREAVDALAYGMDIKDRLVADTQRRLTEAAVATENMLAAKIGKDFGDAMQADLEGPSQNQEEPGNGRMI
jgi:hypothetical protein